MSSLTTVDGLYAAIRDGSFNDVVVTEAHRAYSTRRSGYHTYLLAVQGCLTVLLEEESYLSLLVRGGLQSWKQDLLNAQRTLRFMLAFKGITA